LLGTTKRHEYADWLPRVTPAFDWTPRHIQAILTELHRITTGENDRLMIFMPPRHSKSETVTVHYPAWRLEMEPALRVISGSYNQTLANKFSRSTRRKLRQRGVVLNRDRDAAEEWETAEGGGMKAIGVGAGVTGSGADLIIIDDPVKNREEANSLAYRERVWDWYTDDLFTRREPGAAIILIMTRWHDDDLAGRILASEDEDSWTVLSLPAEAEGDDWREVGEPLWPERYDAESLAEIRGVLGDEWYALYQQRPQSAEGGVFKRAWFSTVDRFPDLVFSGVYWDTAFGERETNDYTAASIVGRDGNGDVYIMPLVRERLEFPALVEKGMSVRQDWKMRFCIEAKASGKSMAQALRKLGVPAIELDPGGRDKVARAHSVTEWFESGKAHFVNCSMLPALIDEMLSFPSGKHDDLVDTVVHGIRNVTTGVDKRKVKSRGDFKL